jgi:phosphoglycolate phosphatase
MIFTIDHSFDSLIFDLDGTLWDTCATCALAWNEVLRRNAISFRTITAQDVRSVTGLPHAECIDRIFVGLDANTRRLITEETMIEDNLYVDRHGGELYDGVLDGIPKLAQRYKLLIVSNCQSGYIETFLRLTGLAPFFTDIECWGNTGESKSANTASLIKRNALSRPLLIGDTAGDALAAKDNKLPFAFVTYGFGKVDKPDIIFDTFDQLVAQLLND